MIVFIIIFTGILLFVFKSFQMEWESPAGVNILFNSLMIISSCMAFGNSVEWTYLGVLWILISCLLFLCGQKFGTMIKSQNYHVGEHNTKEHLEEIYFVACMVCEILGLFSVFLTIRSYGFNVSQLLQLDNLVDINTEIAYNRYYGSTSVSVIQSILNMVMYFTAIFGGYLFPYAKSKKEKAIAISALIPIVCVCLITNTKSGMIFSIVLWIIGWMIAEKSINPFKPVLSFKTILRGICVFVVLIFFLLFVMMLRIGSIDAATWGIVTKKIIGYAFGQVYAFDNWIGNLKDISYGFGSNTFMTVTNWLGLTTRIQGVYSDTVSFGNGYSGNVYTRYRGEIMDFGIIGAQIFEFILGTIAGVTWKKLVNNGGNASAFSLTILAAIYFMVIEGMVVSPWVYTSYTVAFFLFFIMLYMMKRLVFVIGQNNKKPR